MKKLLFILTMVGILFTSCYKPSQDDIKPVIPENKKPDLTRLNNYIANVVAVLKKKAQARKPSLDSTIFGITLHKDNVDNKVDADGTLIIFQPDYHTGFFYSEDAPYFTGYGTVALSNVSSDNTAQAMGGFPYDKNYAIKLLIGLKLSGKSNYVFALNQSRNMPKNAQIYIHDINAGTLTQIEKPLNFTADGSDTLTYRHRFEIVFKK